MTKKGGEKMHKLWTNEEDKYLISTCANGDRPLQMLAEELERTESAVNQRIKKLGKLGDIPRSNVWWSNKSEAALKRNILLDYTNSCVNVAELAKKTGKTEGAVNRKIGRMRELGQLPKIDLLLQPDIYGRPYSEHDKQILVSMYRDGQRHIEIAEVLGRTKNSVDNFIRVARKKGDFPHYKKKPWTEEEVSYVLANVKFDENGYCSSLNEMKNHLKRDYDSVAKKVAELRLDKKIKILPNGKGSIKGNEAFAELNQRQYKLAIHYKEIDRRYWEQKKTNSDSNPSRQVTN